MIDIHSHILPGLDDGSQSLEQSIEMVRMAAAHGTTDIVATPHANLDYPFDFEIVTARLCELSAAVGDSIRIHRGCDFHLHYDNIQDALQNPSKYTINQKSYLLVEFSDLVIFQTTGEIFARMRNAGMIPVITHPERNGLLQQRLSLLEGWVREGCCLQVTAGSLLGHFGKKAREFSMDLIRRGLVHFVASDAHDTERRTPALDEAFAEVSERFGRSSAEALFVGNPGAALTGSALFRDVVIPTEQARKWYEFWR